MSVLNLQYRYVSSLEVNYPIRGQERPLWAHKSGEFVSPTHRPRLPPRRCHGTHFCWRLNRPQSIPSGKEPATWRLAGQCLNQLCHHVPRLVHLVLETISTSYAKTYATRNASWDGLDNSSRSSNNLLNFCVYILCMTMSFETLTPCALITNHGWLS
jgi:hypothetical protein